MHQRDRNDQQPSGKKQPNAPQTRRALVEEVEPRVLLSADLGPFEAAFALDATVLDANPQMPRAAADDLTSALVAERVSRELVFVDAGIEGYEQLVDDLRSQSGGDRRIEVVVLDGARDGVDQISQVLAGLDYELDALHVVSHGSDAGVQLGNSWLDAQSLAERGDALAGWGKALGEDADLLFYGCDFAASSDGRSLVDAIASLTGADVAASSDATGAAVLGGDWELEYAAGAIETEVAFTQNAQRHFAGILDGTAIWAEDSSTVPEANDIDTTVFTGEYPTADVGEWVFIEEADAPTREEKIVVGVDGSGKITGQMWDGTSWSALPFNAALPTIAAGNDGVSVAYESHSGDAILAYSNGTNGVDSVSYRVWDGASWSAEQTLTTPFASAVHRLRMQSSPLGNEVMLAGSTANRQDFAVVWNGAVWGNEMALHDGTGAAWTTDISVAYEQQSGDAMVLWGENALSVHYRQWTGSSWTPESTLAPPLLASGSLQWTTVASDPTSDRIVLGATSDGRDAWLSVWNGSAWSASLLTSVFLTNVDSGQRVAVAFEASSGQALASWAEVGWNSPLYRTWDGGWSGVQIAPSLGGQIRALRLDADRGTDRIMLSALTNFGEIVYSGWYGGDVNSWGAAGTQEPVASSNSNLSFTFSWDDGAVASALWLSTLTDVSGGGQAGADTWQGGDVLQLGGADFRLEPEAGGTTQGSLSLVFDVQRFSPDAETSAVHYVGSDIRLGASNFQLRAGDLILASDGNTTLTSTSTPGAGFTNSLAVVNSDVFVFRPDTPGDYSQGTFALLIADPSGVGRRVHGITLVEQRTRVGETFLDPGDFLFAQSGGGNLDTDIMLFQTLDVGAASGGTVSVFLNDTDAGVAISDRIDGLDLVEETTTLGGRVLRAGTLLVSSSGGGSIAGLAISPFDIVALEVSATTFGSGAGVVSASLVLEGAELGFDSPGEEFDGFSLAALANRAPVLTPSAPSLTTIDEDALTNPGDLVGDILADANVSDLGGFAITGLNSGNGTWQYQLDGGAWTDVGAVSPTAALLLRDIDAVRFVPDGANADSADFDFRAWDQSEFGPGVKLDPGAGGGSSAFSAASDTASIAVTALNDAPTVAGTAASQPVADSGTVAPFSAVTISDVDLPAETLTVTVSIDDLAKGTLTNLGLFSDDGAGNYQFLGTAAQATAAIRALTFDPNDSRLVSGSSELAVFTISVDDGSVATPISDASTTVLVTGENAAPVLTPYAPTLPTISEDATTNTGVAVATLLGTSVSDSDPGAVEGIAITLFTASNGIWQYQLGSGAWTDVPTSVSNANALLIRDTDRIRFLPDGQNAGAGSLGYRAWDQSSGIAGTLVDPGVGGGKSAFSVVGDKVDIATTAVQDLPTINGTVAGQTIGDTDTIDPFQAVVIGDVDAPADTLAVVVRLDDAARGSLTNLGAFVDAGAGVYTFSGTAAQATAAIQALTFHPTDARVAPGQSETTTFTIEVDDGGGVQSDALTTVVAIAQSDGSLLWSQNGDPVPRTSSWDGTTFGPVTPTANVGNQWLVMAGAESPYLDEKIVVGVDGSKTLGAQIWNGSSWSSLGVLGKADSNDRWSFDVAYASQSGRAMVVYGDETLGLSYRVWDGTLWSASVSVATPLPAAIEQMRLASNPRSDEMVLIVSTRDKEDYALVWNGTTSSWGDAILLHDGTGAADTTDVQVVYEQQSGRAMVLYSKGTTNAYYRIWDGGWQAEGTIVGPGGFINGEVLWGDVAADPNSNRIVFSALTDDDDAWVAIWDGAGSWTPRGITLFSSVKDAPNVAVAFDSLSGDALVVYSEFDTRVRYRTWSAGSGWSLPRIGPDIGNTPTSMTLDADPYSSTIMLTVQEDGDKVVNAVAWNGSAWGSVNQLGTTTGESKHQPFLFLWDQGDLLWTNTAPAIAGTLANQALNDNATLAPFQAVVIADPDAIQMLTVTVSLDDAAKGALTNLGSFVDQTGGVYEFQGSAAAATLAIQALSFDPNENRLAVGGSETASLKISVDDGIAVAMDTTTSVVATSVNDAPTVAGALANQPVDDTATVDPFRGIAIADVDPGTTVTVDIQLDDPAKGVLTNLGSFTDQTGGLYRFTGTPAAATAAIRTLTFDPTENRVAVGASETTTFAISVDDGEVALPTSDALTSVVSTSINDAPTIAGTLANQTVDDSNTLEPFGSVAIGDVDPGTTLTVDIQLDDAAKGVLTNLGSFTDQTGGLYRFTGTPAAATAAIRTLTFDPAEQRVAVGASETTYFRIAVDDGVVAVRIVDNTTSVVSLSVNDAPAIAGTVANQAVDDNATVDPFQAVVISDPDRGESLTVDIQLDDASKGVLTNLGGFADLTGGLYRFTGTPAASTAAIRALRFDPTDNRVAAGATETTTFTISVDDGVVATPTVDATTSVVATSVNDTPTIVGSVANQAVDDTNTVDPFQAVAIADVDLGATVTVDIQLDDPAKGVLTNLGSFTDQTGGLYRFTGTPAAATAAIRTLTFAPAENRVAVGASETTTFTISIDDGEVALPTSDAFTSVVSTSINDAPTITGTLANQTVDDSNTLDPFGSVAIADVDPGTTLTVEIQLDDAGRGVLTNLGAFADQGGGVYRMTGTPGALTTAIRALTFNPAENRVAPGLTETTRFTIRAGDGQVATPIADSTTTVVSLSVNDAPTIAGALAGQAVDDDATVDPFQAVVIADLDGLATLTVDVQLDDASKGVLTNLGGFTDLTGGLYRFVGTPGLATAAIQGLRFDPSENRVAVGSTETTRFAISVDDGVIATPTLDALTTVVSTSVNDAPTLALSSPSLPGIDEDQTNDVGVLLSSLLGATISDADPGSSRGIAITNTQNGNGTWQYSSDGGATWNAVGPASDTSARLLLLTDRVRFVPDTLNGTLAGFQFRAWDQTAGTPGGSADTTAAGVRGPFSSASDLATIAVASVNDAPTLGNAPTFAAGNPNGRVVSGLFVGRFADVDSGDTLSGVAVVGNTANAASQGVWEYSTDGGANWAPIASVGDGPNALALDRDARVRFTSAPGFAGAPAALVVRGLDQSYAGSFSSTAGGTEARAAVDTTTPGGVSPVAGNTSDVSTIVVPPTIGPPADPGPDPDPTPDPDPSPEPGPAPDPVPTPDPLPDPTPDPGVDLDPDPGSTDPSVVPGSVFDPQRVPIENELPGIDEGERDDDDREGSELQFVSRFGLLGDSIGFSTGNSIANLILGGGADDFVRELDEIRAGVQEMATFEVRMMSASAALTTSLSVGYVVWLTRGGLLLASVLSSMPAWRLIDPIPVLAQLALKRDEDDESLGSMVSASEPAPPAAPPDSRPESTPDRNAPAQSEASEEISG